MKQLIRIACAGLTLLSATIARAAEPAITPRPALVAMASGTVTLRDGTAIVVPPGDREADDVARYLAGLSARAGGPRLSAGGAAQAGGAAIRFLRRPGLAPEGYALDIDGTGVTIAASTRAGLLYGAVSLWQLLSVAPDHRLARVHIEDAPRFPWRGIVVDSARHFRSPDEIARTIDWMALHKLNRLQWHLADDQGWRVAIPGYPRLTSVMAWRTSPPAASVTPGRYGGFYTPADIRRLMTLAAARNVTIVPEIEMPGHATAAILAYPELGFTTATAANLGDWGIFDSIYGIDAPAFTFLHRALDQLMALFPAQEIAIGGDEAVHRLWHGSPAVQARMKALGLKDEAALQAWFVGRIGAYLHAHGRRLVGWDEILADNAVPADGIVLSWHGADGALAAAHAGHDVVMSTEPTLYFDYRQSAATTEPPGRGRVVPLADVYAFDPANPPHGADTKPLDTAAAKHILGVQAPLWSEYITTDAMLEEKALPRAAALAEIGWTAADRRDWPGFVSRLPAMFARYRALGLHVGDGAVVPQPTVRRDGAGARVTLARQLDLGTIRYTSDGTAPTAASAAYTAPLDVRFPTRLRAASFAGTQSLSRETDLALDAVSASRRSSQQLELCGDAIPINLPGRATSGSDTPPYLVDIRGPCWIDRDADLQGIGHVAVRVAALPFNFQFANEAAAEQLPPVADPKGSLVARRGCDGPVLATASLGGVPRDGFEHELVAAIPAQAGRGDLCLRLDRRTLDPLWVLGSMELRP